MQGASSELKLTIVAGTDPIAGSITFPDGSRIGFSGYVQLVAVLERVREGLADDAEGPRATR